MYKNWEDKLWATCPGCGDEQRKNNMYTVSAKTGNGQPKVAAHFCKKCWAKLLERYGIAE